MVEEAKIEHQLTDRASTEAYLTENSIPFNVSTLSSTHLAQKLTFLDFSFRQQRTML